MNFSSFLAGLYQGWPAGGGWKFGSVWTIEPSGSFLRLADSTLPAFGQDLAAYGAFALYILLIAAGGLAAILSRSLVRALVGLVTTFMGVAGLYLLLAAPFLAFMQLLIYVGAVCVLIFFALMLLKNADSGEEARAPGLIRAGGALAAAAAPLALFGYFIVRFSAELPAGPARPIETPLAELGAGLLSYYVLPFELISIILLAAMAGGVLLVWDKRFGN